MGLVYAQRWHLAGWFLFPSELLSFTFYLANHLFFFFFFFFFVRNIQFFGLDAQQKVTASYVVVIGLGGVGSHAANMLLRSGVGRLLLVDFDQVMLTEPPSVRYYNKNAI